MISGDAWTRLTGMLSVYPSTAVKATQVPDALAPAMRQQVGQPDPCETAGAHQPAANVIADALQGHVLADTRAAPGGPKATA